MHIVHVFDGVIDYLMRELCAVVSAPFIRDQSSVRVHFLGVQRVKYRLRPLYDYLHADARPPRSTIPTTMALPLRLARLSAKLRAFGLVHIADASADKALVHFHDAAELAVIRKL